jgi:hypothetical protein
VVIAHPRTALEPLGLPLEELEVIRRDGDLLRDVVLIDCPDPDTSEGDVAGSNLARLRALLPYCDVLLYTSTQQKYRSARVLEELGQGAAGCRLIFVQTHADLDADIRDDWRTQLRGQYEAPDVFFVDSLRALREQQAGQRPGGEFGRLVESLTTQLAASERVRVRRANVLDLLLASLLRSRDWVQAAWPPVEQLQQALADQHQQLTQRMSEQLSRQLQGSRRLWEQRLLAAVNDNWGCSPFAGVLRTYAGLGGLLASFSLFRARSTAQMALVGALHGARWVRNQQRKKSGEAEARRVMTEVLNDDLLREAELVMLGYIRAADLDASAGRQRSLSALREQAAAVEQEFLGGAGRKIDDIIRRLADRNSRWYVRGWYELLFSAYLAFVLYRMGRNFFVDSFLHGAPLLSTDFYIPAAGFLALWALLLTAAFTRRLRRGLQREVDELARTLVADRLSRGLFPQGEQAVADVRKFRDDLDSLILRLAGLRDAFALTGLGAGRLPTAPAASAPTVAAPRR